MKEQELFDKIREVESSRNEVGTSCIPKTVKQIPMAEFREAFGLDGEEDVNVSTLLVGDETFVEVKQGFDYFDKDKNPISKEECEEKRRKYNELNAELRRLRNELKELWREQNGKDD